MVFSLVGYAVHAYSVDIYLFTARTIYVTKGMTGKTRKFLYVRDIFVIQPRTERCKHKIELLQKNTFNFGCGFFSRSINFE